ncbi:MAG: NAD-dependent epimerase/dehydratase family protein [Planctomycetota bacterium]|nr:MAG: NAD-dependent epimerase/dehydratase family protein [Planctomycetota bacterium]
MSDLRTALPRKPAGRVPLPLLVTGLAGVPGYQAFQYFARRYPGQVVGIYGTAGVKLQFSQTVACDIEDRKGLETLFRRWQFAAVLDCAGNCALKPCELEPRIAQTINIDGCRNLLRFARGDVRLVRLSIDLVFSGEKGEPYTEADPPDPVTVYGKTMAEAEKIVLDTHPRACILRISLPMGRSPGGHAGAIDWIESRFAAGRPATLYYDEIRTPTYCDCLNRVCEEVLAGSVSGLFHAGGPRALSLYEIAQIINRTGGYDPELLYGIPRRHAGPIPPRAGDVRLDSTRLAKALGRSPFLPWPVDDRLIPTDRRWHFAAHGDTWRGNPDEIDRLLCVPGRRTACDQPT